MIVLLIVKLNLLARRRTISQGHNYHAVGKSKNIILSSEAQSPIELRGPHDVANLVIFLLHWWMLA
jgi:RNase P/RNase MRP subunit p30